MCRQRDKDIGRHRQRHKQRPIHSARDRKNTESQTNTETQSHTRLKHRHTDEPATERDTHPPNRDPVMDRERERHTHTQYLASAAEDKDEDDGESHGQDVDHPEPGSLFCCGHHLINKTRLQTEHTRYRAIIHRHTHTHT